MKTGRTLLTLSPGLQRAALLFSARSINPVVSLLFSLIAGRLLTVEDHGVYGWSLARIFVVQAFAEVGLQQSLIRFLSPAVREGRLGDAAAIVRASMQLKLYAFSIAAVITAVYMAIVVLAGRLALPPGIDAQGWISTHPDQLTLAWLILLGGCGMSILTYLDAILVSHENYVRLSLWLPSTGVIRLGLLGLFLALEQGSLRAEHVLFAFALGPYLSIAAFFFLHPAAELMPSAPASAWRPWAGRLLRYNAWIMAAAFMAILSDWMEVLLIDRPGDNGLFNAARMPMQGFLILLATMSSLLLPRFSRLESVDEFRAIFRRIYQVLVPGFLIFLPGFWIFPWFITAWFGPEYLPSVTVFYILYPNFILRIYFAPLGAALFALDQPRLIAIEAGLRMFSGYFLVQALYSSEGIVGAAWASLIAQAFGWVFLLFCYRSYFTTGRFPLDSRPAPGGPSTGQSSGTSA